MRKGPAGGCAATAAIAAALVLAVAGAVSAGTSAESILADLRLSADEKSRVLAGEFVSRDVAPTTERDLSVSIAFLAHKPPAALSDEMLAGDLLAADRQSEGLGLLQGNGSLADFAALKVPNDLAQTFLNAQPGETLNLSSDEIAAFNALRGAATAVEAVQAQLRRMLLARFRAYQSRGLDGIAPYARAGGERIDPGDELRKASEATKVLKKYMPTFQRVLLGYPEATVPGLQQTQRWVAEEIDGTLTYALVQVLAAPDGEARVVAQREYYVSTGYNAEQAVAGFVPVQEGTLVLYVTHTFTDQVAGFGGAVKRSIGQRLLTTKLEEIFQRQRGL